MSYTFIELGHVASPMGWRVGVAACGIRYRRQDLALLISDTPCSAAALFTTNKVRAAHILYDEALLLQNNSAIRGVLINSGSANACTGEIGLAAAATTAQAVEQTLDLPPNSILVMSTGVIGVQLPVDRVLRGITRAAHNLQPHHGPSMAHAIMTTDTRPKQCAVRVRLPSGSDITIGGVAKGSGMIHPNMATMLATLTTDATVQPATLKAALRYAVDRSFHCITVDHDTSTNDTVLALANGQAASVTIRSAGHSSSQELTDRLHDYLIARAMDTSEHHIQTEQLRTEIHDLGGSDSDLETLDDMATDDVHAFTEALTAVCQYLAREVARDGEGATRLITIQVRGAKSEQDAHRAAMAIACSPLVKTALFGADPNWGRMVCALGYSGADIDVARLTLSLSDTVVFAQGLPVDFDEEPLRDTLSGADVVVAADLAMGNSSATVWTCDLSYNYIKINTDYRT